MSYWEEGALELTFLKIFEVPFAIVLAVGVVLVHHFFALGKHARIQIHIRGKE
jgi:hypothetical protein